MWFHLDCGVGWMRGCSWLLFGVCGWENCCLDDESVLDNCWGGERKSWKE